MDLNLRRSRLSYNTANGKENVPPRFYGELPINPYFQFSDPHKKPALGIEYVGFMGSVIDSHEQDE